MKKYGLKTKKIIFLLVLLSILFTSLAVFSLILDLNYFQGLVLIATISTFLCVLIYFTIYRQFLKLEKIAEEMEK